MPTRRCVDAVLKDLLDQIPGLAVQRITLTPPNPLEGQEVTAVIDIADSGSVICTVSADGRLQSARVQGDD